MSRRPLPPAPLPPPATLPRNNRHPLENTSPATHGATIIHPMSNDAATQTAPAAQSPAYVIETRTSQTPWNRDLDLGPYASTEAAAPVLRAMAGSAASPLSGSIMPAVMSFHTSQSV